jgi:hypothetical protein
MQTLTEKHSAFTEFWHFYRNGQLFFSNQRHIRIERDKLHNPVQVSEDDKVKFE